MNPLFFSGLCNPSLPSGGLSVVLYKKWNIPATRTAADKNKNKINLCSSINRNYDFVNKFIEHP